MDESELRELVRDALARHLGSRADSPPAIVSPASRPHGAHASHAVYLAVLNPDDACVIEPSVTCNHCNYCKSHGH
jgi:hypothetical protein